MNTHQTTAPSRFARSIALSVNLALAWGIVFGLLNFVVDGTTSAPLLATAVVAATHVLLVARHKLGLRPTQTAPALSGCAH